MAHESNSLSSALIPHHSSQKPEPVSVPANFAPLPPNARRRRRLQQRDRSPLLVPQSMSHDSAVEELLPERPFDIPLKDEDVDGGVSLSDVLNDDFVRGARIRHQQWLAQTPIVDASAVKKLRDFSKELQLAGEYRSGYTNWRQGKAKGAKGEIRSAYEEAEKHRWLFRSVSAYCTSVTFVWGSWNFVVASALWYFKDVANNEEHSLFGLVCFPYFVASVLFTFGSYVSYFEVINSDANHDFQTAYAATKYGYVSYSESYVGSFAYLVGSLIFNVACFMGLDFVSAAISRTNNPDFWTQLLVDLPNTVGGLLFAIGGGCEAKINHIFSFNVYDLGWWVGLTNGAGGTLFLLGAVGGWLVPHIANTPDETLFWTRTINATPYFIGSLLFFIGGCFMLWMWKLNQFGLGLMRWMNRHTPTHIHSPVGKKQFFALIITEVCGATCLCNWCVAVWQVVYEDDLSRGYLRLARSTLSSILMVCVTMVFSFLHRTPQFRPLRLLMTVARWWLLAQCAYEVWEFAASFAKYTS